MKVQNDFDLDQSLNLMPNGISRDIPTKHRNSIKARSIKFNDHPGQIKGLRSNDKVTQSDVVTFQQQVKHLQPGPGPASYQLPQLISQKPAMSTMRTSPSVSLGMRLRKKSYFQECSKDFVGIDAPPVNKYSPNDRPTISKSPEFS